MEGKLIAKIQMKRIITILTVLTLFTVSCTKTELNLPKAQDRTIIVSATIPADETASRVSYTTTDGSLGITLKWNDTDKLMLCFVHNGNYYHKEASIVSGSISQEGKKADFKIEVPKEIPAGTPFTLHAIYQQTDGNKDNGGCFEENTERYVFEGREEWCLTLDKKNNAPNQHLGTIRPALISTRKEVTTATLNNLSFQHMGWVMALHLQNTTGKDQPLPESLSFQSDANASIWNGYHFDHSVSVNLNDGKIESKIPQKNSIVFDISNSPLWGKTLKNGNTIILYRWLLSTHQTDNMTAYLLSDNGKKRIDAPAILPHKTVKPGMVYHVHLKWSDNKLELGK